MPDSFADIILPLAIKRRLTYSIPFIMKDIARPGVKAMVQLGNRKLYTGIIARIHSEHPGLSKIRSIVKITDTNPVVNERQLRLWKWISDYYMCSEGEVMKAAVPGILFPEGNTTAPVAEKYKPKTETFVKPACEFSEEDFNNILDKLKKAPRQADLLTAYLHLSDFDARSQARPVKKSLMLKNAGSTPAILGALIKKGILECISLEVGRLAEQEFKTEPVNKLSPAQQCVIDTVKDHFRGKNVVLLHGITSSGKTEIYIHLIEEQLKQGKQVLYLLPEIALTTQIILRLQKHFGSFTGVYHSRFNEQEKAEIWKRVAENDTPKGFRLILGVRSSVFLPFSDLGLVIIDEEHDGSYKQHDPAPRYHARDTAIVLATFHKAKTIMGSASPSVESYYNAVTGKYGLAELKERFGSVRLPEIILTNTREAYRKKLMVSHFTPELLNAIDQALGKEEQVILFRNRRGFSPYIECQECGWIQVCRQCAVNMTYHKAAGSMVCHYCGYNTAVQSKCGNCGSSGLATRGFGTEKIEDEIKIVFPAARVGRMDQDTTRGKNAFNKIISAFGDKRIDILIGTQMISKGLDFENLTVVGILNADNLLNFPDFRAHERSFQLMEQVSGRAGRRQKQGKVIIQTSDPGNKIIRLVLRHDYTGLYRIQSEERKMFNYPPFCRMIRINLKHKERMILNSFADTLGNELKNFFGNRVLGPEFPVISQVQLYYIKTILIKIEIQKPLARAKEMIRESIERLERSKGAGGIKIAVDVDPY
ncbi:MAG TPA: primosomal protein N' [Bacteroidales bacterium]|nr:primosomal protein N' [Bacteroidales bacterium]